MKKTLPPTPPQRRRLKSPQLKPFPQKESFEPHSFGGGCVEVLAPLLWRGVGGEVAHFTKRLKQFPIFTAH